MPKRPPPPPLSYVLRTPTIRTEYKGAHAEGIRLLFVGLPDALARRKMLDDLEKTHARLLQREDAASVGVTPAHVSGATCFDPACRECADPSARNEAAPLTRCAAAQDGDCSHAQCPQLRDGEPKATGRHCPLDNRGDDE